MDTESSEFDHKFDEGEESVLEDLDLTRARRPGLEQKCGNVDFPVWMISALDCEARCLGVTRQSVIKMWLAERLEKVIQT
jgi:hypothetical protein